MKIPVLFLTRRIHISKKRHRVLIVLNIDDCDELRIWDCESNREMRVISLEQFDGKLRPGRRRAAGKLS